MEWLAFLPSSATSMDDGLNFLSRVMYFRVHAEFIAVKRSGCVCASLGLMMQIPDQAHAG